MDPITHLENPLQYQDNHFKVDGKKLISIILYSSTKVYIFFTILTLLTSCTVISEKASQKADKENAYLSTFLNKSSNNLNQTFGKPTQILTENNQSVHIYEIKGKVFDCQRKFTIDNKNIVTGFVSTCWD